MTVQQKVGISLDCKYEGKILTECHLINKFVGENFSAKCSDVISDPF